MRITDIISANVNDLLDRAEDPEKMIKYMITEMEEHLDKAREGAAKAIAAEKQLEATLKTHKDAVIQWQEKAEAAFDQGQESLARECLVRKRQHQTIAEGLVVQWDSARAASEAIKRDYRLLEDKVEEAKRRRDILIARQLSAQAFRDVGKAAPAIMRAETTYSRFEQIERRVAQTEGEARAYFELNNLDRALKDKVNGSLQEAEVDADLESLRKRTTKPVE